LADESAHTLKWDEFLSANEAENQAGLLTEGNDTLRAATSVVPQLGTAGTLTAIPFLGLGLLIANRRSHLGIVETPMAMAL
jgi:hypothetical protein